MAIEVDLGFAEPVDVDVHESHLLTSKFFPSKIGGRPAWLDLDKLPDSEKELCCHGCRRPLTFLVQLYAPIEEEPKAFHRTLFVFACNNSGCTEPSNRVFRSQLERANKFYPFDPPNYDLLNDDDQNNDPIGPEKFNVTLCHVCGCLARKKCSGCRKAAYCSKEHQTYDWKYGQHKLLCKSDSKDDAGDSSRAINSSSNGLLFKEYEVVIETDELNEDLGHDEEDDQENGDMNAYQEALRRLKPDCQNEDIDEAASNQEDAAFSKFSATIRKNKDQIVRYYKYDRMGSSASPLWATDANQLTQQPPPCPNCQSTRALEFQLMPQIINLLGQTHLDFATLTIYTCTGNCQSQNCGYQEEFCWTQKYDQ